jgi:hypothetical protein
MPEHPVRSAGAAFDPDAGALAELARWDGNGDALLRAIAETEPGSTEIRAWPHHFDIGGIVLLTPDGLSGPQIGFGLSPGDRHYEEPYFYLTASPRRDDATYPELAGGGVWRQGDFTGAVLVGPSFAAAGGAEQQAASARAFFRSAFAGARSGVLAP